MILAFLLLAAQSTFTVTNSTYNGDMRRPASARLVWHDEFDGKVLDPRKWQYDTGRNKEGWFNRERQYYSAGQNLSVAKGLLTIEARHERLDSAIRTGAARTTRPPGSFRRGQAGPTDSTKSAPGCLARPAPGRRSGCCLST